MSDRTTIPFRVQRPAWIDEFRAFIMRGNVIDLAVGIIIGVAFTSVVNSLVKDIFTPIIGLAVGGIDFTNIFVTLKGPSEPTLADAQKAGAVTLNIGVFLNAVIQFLIVSFAIFWLIKALTRLHVREEAAPAAPPRTEVLREEIRDLLAAKRNQPSPSKESTPLAARPRKTSRRPVGAVSVGITAKNPVTRRCILRYSITSSARARIDGGTVSPSAWAVLRLTTSSNVVGCCTGRSAGFTPFRILPA